MGFMACILQLPLWPSFGFVVVASYKFRFHVVIIGLAETAPPWPRYALAVAGYRFQRQGRFNETQSFVCCAAYVAFLRGDGRRLCSRADAGPGESETGRYPHARSLDGGG